MEILGPLEQLMTREKSPQVITQRLLKLQTTPTHMPAEVWLYHMCVPVQAHKPASFDSSCSLLCQSVCPVVHACPVQATTAVQQTKQALNTMCFVS